MSDVADAMKLCLEMSRNTAMSVTGVVSSQLAICPSPPYILTVQRSDCKESDTK